MSNGNNTTENQNNAVNGRKTALKALQQKRGSKIISYVVNTRQGVNYQIADDAVRIIYDHLLDAGVGNDTKIDLFLHSFGGAGVVPWKLVNLIREFSKKFEVIIPYKAYSAATLIALGANKIIMHPMGELGPVDPKVGNEFNPVTPQGQSVGINVEDVVSYISLIKEQVGIRHEDELVQAFNILANQVHPLALGNVHRFYSQSRMMTRKLLKLHTEKDQEHKIDEIVETLTSKLFFHGHPINRKEAKEINLKVEEPDSETEKLIWKLYQEYESNLELTTPFNPNELLNSSNQNDINVNVRGACVESENLCHAFISELRIMRPPIPQNAPLQIQLQAQTQAMVVPLKSGWVKE
ncbi:MAG: hypothetical protein A3I88_03950 [Candidatus Portnoybacteria bacterium RIFCSPLOWO2_12_FULL_39_9]|nr:MAG: hypothetical protein A2646_01975 [Candidatus Portnoybacteria bacterium RIFCSPHIGHO2_02_FULL_39_12]OGZ38146.1 MAG: hypothetical protein A3F21_03840 [Candidatus Portnoybacteria bacterium RIFCSPLOWO2_01_FULL_38_39]OGZ40263.1 MAG: hypothetical protein A3I88_03950 [Candidatus Portnoybacteria bacterium RIFCSPLOWO2_12_FULL_39_9]